MVYYYDMNSTLPVTVLITFPIPISINRYSFVSGNDVPERDHKSWTFETSIDGVKWRLTDNK